MTRPLSLVLLGNLADVMVRGALSIVDTSHGVRRLQVIRYAASSAAYCRVVRIQILVGGEVYWTITPKGQTDEIYLEIPEIPEGQPFELRLIRDPQTSTAVLPNPFPGSDVRLEAFG